MSMKKVMINIFVFLATIASHCYSQTVDEIIENNQITENIAIAKDVSQDILKNNNTRTTNDNWTFVFNTKVFETDRKYWDNDYNSEVIHSPNSCDVYVNLSNIEDDPGDMNIKIIEVKEIYHVKWQTFGNKKVNYAIYKLKILCGTKQYYFPDSSITYLTDGTTEKNSHHYGIIENLDDRINNMLSGGVYDNICRVIY